MTKAAAELCNVLVIGAGIPGAGTIPTDSPVDAGLPDGDGVVLAQTLARCHPRARVAIYTGHHGIAERLREMNRGCACPVLTKPVTLSHLLWVLGLGALSPPAHGAPADFSLADDTALPLTKVLACMGLTRRGISGCPRNRHRDSPQPSGGGFRCSARAFIARP